MILVLAFVMLAAAGSLTRAAVAAQLNEQGGMAWGTLAVNLAGSAALGLLAGVGAPVATLAGTAFLGALTTFSSFARDTMALVEERRLRLATIYVVATICGSVALAWFALAIRGP